MPREPDLPITPFLPRIAEALEESRVLVLTAETGAGKSTAVPPYLLRALPPGNRGILMLEPRRVAASAVAARIAENLGSRPGGAAGYRVRGDEKAGPDTRILVVTEGLLVRMIQDDPLLDEAALVIFDEFHERSLHADTALALMREVRRARPDLALLVMSATMETGRVSAFLDGAPVLACPGRTFPVETRYQPDPGGPGWEKRFAAGLCRIAAAEEGGILAFLPGMREILRVRDALTDPASPAALPAGTEVLVLHGSLPLEEQRKVLRPPEGRGRRRVVLSTSLAETSLTVPDIRIVIDSGWTRTERFHPRTGMNRLVTERVCRPAADQRKGRAGRLGPGLCVRFWEESLPLRSSQEPEMSRSDLAGLVLECAAWGARNPEDLEWLDPPPPGAWKKGKTLLRELGALDGDGGAAERGRRILAMGLAPRLGAMVLRGEETGRAGSAAVLAAILEERDPPGAGGDPDFRRRLAVLRGEGSNAEGWRRNVLREAGRILRRCRRSGDGGSRESAAPEAAAADSGLSGEAGRILSAGFPDRTARRNPDGSFSFVSGRRAVFPRGTEPGLSGSAWIVAPAVDPGDPLGTIRLAASLEPEDALAALAPFAGEETVVGWKGLVPVLRRVKRAGKLLLEAPRSAAPDPEAVVRSFLRRLGTEGSSFLPWTDGSRRFLARLRLFRAFAGISGSLDEENLAGDAAERLVPQLDPLVLSGRRRGPVLTPGGLLRAVESLAGSRRGDMEKAAPEKLRLPSGVLRRIDYAADGAAVDARIQEVFGLRDGPVICGKPLTFRLLSPAGRPLQITRDLAGFWKNTYPGVRREMRGRYPKHRWPEDPFADAGKAVR